MKNIKVTAGKYILCDPCYCFSHKTDSWDELLIDSSFFENPLANLNGKKVLAFGTKYGDGLYHSSHGHRLPVDAGLIGLVPFELVESGSTYKESSSDCGHVVEFTKETECFNENGVLYFGDICVDTVGDLEDDEEEDDEEWLHWKDEEEDLD